jgi:hypothetical protein
MFFSNAKTMLWIIPITKLQLHPDWWSLSREKEGHKQATKVFVTE